MVVCTREWNSMTARILMATPCTISLGGGTRGHNAHKHEGGEGLKLCWKFQTCLALESVEEGDDGLY